MFPMKESSLYPGHLIIPELNHHPLPPLLLSMPSTDEEMDSIFIFSGINSALYCFEGFKFHRNVFDSHHFIISQPASFLYFLSS